MWGVSGSGYESVGGVSVSRWVYVYVKSDNDTMNLHKRFQSSKNIGS